MKKFLVAVLCIFVTMMFTGCGRPKMIVGKMYDTYGLFNEKTRKNLDIEYEISTGNVIWGIILSGTVFMPVYFLGFSLYNPICKKGDLTPGVVK